MQIINTELLENFVTDAQYIAGTVVVFGGSKEITVTGRTADVSVAGVITQDSLAIMAALESQTLPVVLRGKTQVNVIGPVATGDLLVTSYKPGFAQSVEKDMGYGVSIFAKAISSTTTVGESTIHAVVL